MQAIPSPTSVYNTQQATANMGLLFSYVRSRMVRALPRIIVHTQLCQRDLCKAHLCLISGVFQSIRKDHFHRRIDGAFTCL